LTNLLNNRKKKVQNISRKKQNLIEKRQSNPTESTLNEILDNEINLISEELECETQKYLSMMSKKKEMQEKRISLYEQLKTPKRFSIISKEEVDIMDGHPESDPLPKKPLQNSALFVNAFESLWSTLVYHTGSYLLEEGIKQSTRGFWLSHFTSINSLITTWQTGSQMPIDYISGSSNTAKHHSGGDEEFSHMVGNYNLEKMVCYIMVVDLGTSIACSWGTIDIVGNINTHDCDHSLRKL
jgi:hypothetical protein